MSNLNILVIRFRARSQADTGHWFFVVDEHDRPLTFDTQQAAWDKVQQLTEQSGDTYEYTPNVLTASMSVAEFDGNKALVEQYKDHADQLTTERDNERARAITVESQLRAAKQDHQSDLDLISTTLNSEADDRGYCSSYDDVMRDLDRKLNGNLTFRDREYTVTLDVSLSVQITVKADSEDAAVTIVHGRHLDRSDVVDAARNGDWSINTDGTEVELA